MKRKGPLPSFLHWIMIAGAISLMNTVTRLNPSHVRVLWPNAEMASGHFVFLTKTMALTSSPALWCLGILGFPTESCKWKSVHFQLDSMPTHTCRTFSLTLTEGDKKLTGELSPFVGESNVSSAQGLGPLFLEESNFPDEYYLQCHLRGRRWSKQWSKNSKGLAIVESSHFRVKGRVFEKGIYLGRFLSLLFFSPSLLPPSFPSFLLLFFSLDLRKVVE